MNAPTGPIRFSHLKAYGRSALHGWHARTATDEDPTYAMERGTAVHAICFGTKKVVGYAGTRDERQQKYRDFLAAHPDHEVLTMAEFDKARHMADAVMQHKLAWPLLQGVREETLLFRWNGMECRSTPDVRAADYTSVTELKTAPSADPERFPWHSRRMNYHAQVCFEAIAVQCKFRRAPSDHYIVVVEQTAPYAVQCYRVDGGALEVGEKQLMLWAERLKVAEGSGLYPAYTNIIAPLELPDDHREDDDGEDPGLVFPAGGRAGIDPLQMEHGLQI